jgi:DNA mismatch repair protein MSH2
MSSEYTDLSSQYHRHQSGLVKEVVGIAASYTPVLQQLGSLIGHLDVIVRYPPTPAKDNSDGELCARLC